MKSHLRYIDGSPEDVLERVQAMLEHGELEKLLSKRYPTSNTITSDKSLYDFVIELKKRYLKSSPPIARVLFDKRISIDHHALGLHSTKSRVQGRKLKSKSEIRIADRLKNTPEPLFRSVVIHELAHLKEKGHDKSFYQLCTYMEPDYHQLEFDLRLYLVLEDYNDTSDQR
ncbi:MAG: putative metal-dependent hydrolase [Halieaceae bacterium]|jgi:predicted metal-dependent hydrolase